jgi:hypothetical protein
MKFVLNIRTDNSALKGTPEIEISRLLIETAHRIVHDGLPAQHKNLLDIQGNVVGTFVHKEN